ncbi:Maf family nucleotide pyrophosphatase [Desulfatiferula olefinivorans]
METMRNTPKSRLILASRSPRRKYLLKQAGLAFDVIPSTVDENEITVTEPDHYVRYLAEIKARDVAENYPSSWVLGADTIVLIDGMILGKPLCRDDARKMLKRLSGRTHVVYTGFCLTCVDRGRLISRTVSTNVRFKDLTDHEIDWYIHTPEPFDKAGAYAIQGLGTFLVKSIDGSYTNVVGLPVCEVIETLLAEGVIGQTIGEAGYSEP